MHSFAGMWYGGALALRGQEAFRGRALECAFFSSVAIGGLLLGHPAEMVANHVASAQASVVEFRGLADKHAVSALILCGMMNILLPGSAASADGKRTLDEAETVFESLPDKDPLVAVILSFRRQVEGLTLLDMATMCPPFSSSCSSSSSPRGDAAAAAVKASSTKSTEGESSSSSPKVSSSFSQLPVTDASGDGSAGTRGDSASNAASRSFNGMVHTEEGKAILGSNFDVNRGDSKCTPAVQPAHPSFVVADGKRSAWRLVWRFVRGLHAVGKTHLVSRGTVQAIDQEGPSSPPCPPTEPTPVCPPHPKPCLLFLRYHRIPPPPFCHPCTCACRCLAFSCLHLFLSLLSAALLLSVRFMRKQGVGGISKLRHVHDFVAMELNRLVPARAGALVLISLAGTLLAIKTRLQLADGMLRMAELITAMLAKCPGWGR